jgi:hypothetical protein
VPLAVEEMLTESESRAQSGERNCDSGGGAGSTVKARFCADKGTEDVGEGWNSVVPVIESVEDTIVRRWSLSFAIRVWVWGSPRGVAQSPRSPQDLG